MTQPTYDPIPGVFPAGLIHVIGGSPHAGKSTLIAQLAGALMSGGEWLGMQANAVPVHVVLTDRASIDNDRWLSLLPKRPPILSLVDDPTFVALRNTLPESAHLPGLREFSYVLNKLDPKPGTVLLVDVFSNSFTGNVLNAQSVRSHMTVLSHECSVREITIIGTVYGVKITSGMNARYERFVDRIIGAATFRGGVSTTAYLATREEAALGGLQRLEVVPRGQAPNLITLTRDRNGLFLVTTVEDVGETTYKVGRNRALVLDYINDAYPQVFTMPELTEWVKTNGLDISPGNLRVILMRLVSDGSIDRVSRGMYRGKPAV